MNSTPKQSLEETGLSRRDIIESVKTPLGFFVLGLLVFEAILAVFAAYSSGLERGLLFGAMVLLMFSLICIVAFLAYYRPEALKGDRPENLENKFGPQLERIESRLRELDEVARYGSSGVLVAALLGLKDGSKNRVHCHAGGLTISPILFENLPQTATGFYDMFRGTKHEIKLVEQHIVDSFLRNLIATLPGGSCWLGTTRLQSPEAWRRKSANLAYYEFQRTAERRTKKQELNYFRLWCFDNERHFRQTAPIMQRQREAGFQTRFTVGHDFDDFSIIWIPARDIDKALRVKDVDSPVDEIEAREEVFAPLCAIKFGSVRGGRELDEMTICSPGTDEFKRLCIAFQENWKLGKDLLPTNVKKANGLTSPER